LRSSCSRQVAPHHGLRSDAGDDNQAWSSSRRCRPTGVKLLTQPGPSGPHTSSSEQPTTHQAVARFDRLMGIHRGTLSNVDSGRPRPALLGLPRDSCTWYEIAKLGGISRPANLPSYAGRFAWSAAWPGPKMVGASSTLSLTLCSYLRLLTRQRRAASPFNQDESILCTRSLGPGREADRVCQR